MCGLFSIDYSYPNNIKKAGPEGFGKKKLQNLDSMQLKGMFCGYRGSINPHSEREAFHLSIPIF